MKNPLIKRLPREFCSEIGKYIVIFLLLIGTIGMVSGFLVADGSMISSYNESFEKYNIEDGHFLLNEQADEFQKSEIEKLGIKLYDNFYIEQETKNDSIVRIFADRKDLNKVCLMKGRMPETDDEIAVDRMYADNNNIKAGDFIDVGDKEMKVSGLVALSDYSALFSDNNDSMFDSVKFGVAVMSESGYSHLDQSKQKYCYSWKYDNSPKDERAEKKISDDLAKDINKIVPLDDFVPQYANQAIKFTGDDMGRDKSMMITLLYIITVIIAFVFGITISNTISEEANVIGTLRASGYTKAELVRHYLTMPLIVTVIGAVIGNILGYTFFKDICADLYYGSYSLPTFEVQWNAEAFVLTTVVPFILMLIINLCILINKLSLSPLKFIRRDLHKRTKKKAFKLNTKIKIFNRFRIRIIFQNMSNYITLFVGVIFANLLLMFGLLLPSVLDNYQNEIQDNMLCNYQYILKAPVETEVKSAEKFSAYSLNTPENKFKTDEVTIYGIQNDSKYIDADLDENGVYISNGYAEKFSLGKGDKITLCEKYDDKQYTFTVSGVVYNPGSISVFMTNNMFTDTFDYENDYFNGYFSNEKLDDIDDAYIASVIDAETLTKLSRQLDVSMGEMMNMVNIFAVVMFMILIYLLSKIVIEKNAQSISMTKILGYFNSEISRLYIMSTSIVVVICLLLSLPIEYYAMKWMFINLMMTSLSGWITFYVEPMICVEMFIIGILTYAVIAVLQYRKIKKVPLAEALKNAE